VETDRLRRPLTRSTAVRSGIVVTASRENWEETMFGQLIPQVFYDAIGRLIGWFSLWTSVRRSLGTVSIVEARPASCQTFREAKVVGGGPFGS